MEKSFNEMKRRTCEGIPGMQNESQDTGENKEAKECTVKKESGQQTDEAYVQMDMKDKHIFQRERECLISHVKFSSNDHEEQISL